MADPEDNQAPPDLAPWSWVPPEWQQQIGDAARAAQAAPPPESVFGIPSSALDAAAAPQPELVPTSAPPAGAIPPPIDPSIAGAPGAPTMPALVPPAPVDDGTAPPSDFWHSLTSIGHDAPPPIDTTPLGALDQPQQAIAAQPELADIPQGPAIGTNPFAAAADQEAGARAGELADATAIANMSPEARAALTAQHAERARLETAAAQLKAAHEDMQRAQDDHDAYVKASAVTQAKSDQLVADATRVANTKIDPNRYRNSLSTGERLLQIVGAFVGGYAAGPNVMLAQINKEIDRDIAAQQDDIRNQQQGIDTRKGVIASEYARNGDMYHSAEVHRLALQEGVVRELQAQQQLYDPRGTTAIQLGNAIAGVRAQQGAAVQAYQQQTFKDTLEVTKAQQEQQKIDEAKRAALAKEQLDRQKEYREANAAADKKKAEAVKYPPQVLAAMFPGGPPAPSDMSPGEYDKFVETTNKVTEGHAKTTELGAKTAGIAVRNPITGATLTDKQGAPLVMGSPELASGLNESIGTAQNFIDAAGAARRMLDKDPSLVDRNEWAEVTTNLENAKVAFIEKHRSKASSREMEAMAEVMGPNFEHLTNRVKDKGTVKARLDTLIKSVDRETTTELKTRLGYDGPSPLVDTSKPEPAKADAADRIETNLKTDLKANGEAAKPGNFIVGSEQPFGEYASYPWEDAVKKGLATKDEVARGRVLGIIPPKLRQFDVLREMLRGGDPAARERALGVLASQAKDGNDEDIRQYAAAQLANAQLDDVAGSPIIGEGDPSTATAKEGR